MNSVIEKLKLTALDKNLYTWEHEQAIDLIAQTGSQDSLEALSEISSKAVYTWERQRAMNYIGSLIAKQNYQKIVNP